MPKWVWFDWHKTIAPIGCDEVEYPEEAGRRAYAGASQVFQNLKKSGYSVGILSNTECSPAKLRKAANEAKLPLGIPIVTAYKKKYSKPRGTIFQAALKESNGAEAEDCIMVGDNIIADVGGALAAGWHAIWLRGNQTLTPDPPMNTIQVRRLSQITPKLISHVFVPSLHKHLTRPRRVRPQRLPKAPSMKQENKEKSFFVKDFGDHNMSVEHIDGGDYKDEARKEARAGRSVLIVFHQPWCGYCKRTIEALEKEKKSGNMKARVFLVHADTVKGKNLTGLDLSAVPVLQACGPHPHKSGKIAFSRPSVGAPNPDVIKKLSNMK